MDRLTALIADFSDARIGGGDSFCDRLNCRFTVYILVIFALLITTKHYVGDPIGCWCPAHFTDSHVDYTNKVCWVTNNYYLPFESRVPREGAPKKIIAYYQWVGLFLMVQGVIFYLPRPIWRLLNKKSGVSIATVTDAAIECQRKTDPEARKKTLAYMINHMTRFLRELYRLQMMASPFARLWYIFYGNYMTVMYIVVKILYITNVIGQLFLLNEFLGSPYHLYGWEVLTNLVKGRSWTTSDRFPRVTLCDFKIRVLGHVNRYTVQCALPINLFNEKIFTFLWFWFVFVAIATCCSMVIWIANIVYFPRLVSYVKTKLIAMDRLDHASDDVVQKFTRHYLKRDGMLIVWLVGKNSSDLIASELICGLFTNYREHPKGLDRLCSRDATTVLNAGMNRDPNATLRRRIPMMDMTDGCAMVQNDDITYTALSADRLPSLSDDNNSYNTAVT